MMRRIFEGEMTAELDARIRACLCACFPADRDFFSRSRAWHGTAPAWSLVEEEGGAVIGQIGVVRRRIRVMREEIEVAGIQNVAVLSAARGTGLGRRLMERAMELAEEDGVPYAILFCVPDLRKYYEAQGWRLHEAAVRMTFEGQSDIPIPGKNIAMVRELAAASRGAARRFPPGDIDLRGADW